MTAVFLYTYFNKKLIRNMVNVLTHNVRTLYANVRANGSCYTLLSEPGRATNYLQAELDTKATLRGYTVYVYLFKTE
jgi:hypothetical protein